MKRDLGDVTYRYSIFRVGVYIACNVYEHEYGKRPELVYEGLSFRRKTAIRKAKEIIRILEVLTNAW